LHYFFAESFTHATPFAMIFLNGEGLAKEKFHRRNFRTKKFD
jgi:hypothetical protein